MKKKFLCLFLGLFMIVSMLASCSSGEVDLENVVDPEIRPTQTIVIYLMAEKEVPEKTESDIEDALNKLTKSKFKSQIDLRFFTEENYYEELDKTIKAKQTENKRKEKEENDKRKWQKYLKESCKEAGIPYIPDTTKAPDTAVTEEETIVNQEFGIIEYKYPDARDNQVDIFYVGGYEKYQYYVNEEWAARLNDEVNTSSKKLKEHIPAVYMENITSAGIYGIPTNSLIGEYTWMLLDKEIVEEYSFTSEEISNSLTDKNLMDFLSAVHEFARDENGNLTVLPIKGEVEPVNMLYWSYDEENEMLVNEPSILGITCGINSKIGTNLSVYHVFKDTNYVSQLRRIKEFQLAGFHGTEEDQDKPFAMTIMKGSYDIYNEYKDEYYIKMLEAPKADDSNLYTNMFCVNELENNVARSMEIVTFLNTNAEARNILQYGIEGENYYIDDDGVLHRYNESYMMDVNKTGNIFMAHPEEDLPEDYWDNGIQHNESVGITPIFGFTVDEDSNLNLNSLRKVLALKDEYMDRLNACETLEEFDAFITAANEEFNNMDDYINVFLPRMPEDDNAQYSLGYIYYQWLDQNGYLPK